MRCDVRPPCVLPLARRREAPWPEVHAEEVGGAEGPAAQGAPGAARRAAGPAPGRAVVRSYCCESRIPNKPESRLLEKPRGKSARNDRKRRRRTCLITRRSRSSPRQHARRGASAAWPRRRSRTGSARRTCASTRRPSAPCARSAGGWARRGRTPRGSGSTRLRR